MNNNIIPQQFPALCITRLRSANQKTILHVTDSLTKGHCDQLVEAGLMEVTSQAPNMFAGTWKNYRITNQGRKAVKALEGYRYDRANGKGWHLPN